ncbi:MAG TPA: hypothetical protein VLB45_05880 [Nitrosopumilaceae archaeon]|nr:hypothetical protein [Nitrosopumilaceae archaeon]
MNEEFLEFFNFISNEETLWIDLRAQPKIAVEAIVTIIIIQSKSVLFVLLLEIGIVMNAQKTFVALTLQITKNNNFV